jgi:hypothetical protein
MATATSEASAEPTLTSLLVALKEVAGPQFPACLFESHVRQPTFRQGKRTAVFTHKNTLYDTTKRVFYDSVEEWAVAAANAAAKAGDAAADADATAKADLAFGGGATWLSAAELRLRAKLLLQEFEQRIPTLSELVQHMEHLRTLQDATLWERRRWEESLFVFDTDNRAPTAIGYFQLRYAPRVRCSYSNGKFVDTKTRKQFKTLEGWLAICGEDADLEDVRFARKGLAVPLTMLEVFHRLQTLLQLRKQSFTLYEKCVWRYRYICQGTYDEDEWEYWGDEEDEDTVWSEEEEGSEEGGEEGDEEGEE